MEDGYIVKSMHTGVESYGKGVDHFLGVMVIRFSTAEIKKNHTLENPYWPIVEETMTTVTHLQICLEDDRRIFRGPWQAEILCKPVRAIKD